MKKLLLAAMASVALNVSAQSITVKAIVQSPLCHGDSTASINLLIDGGTAPLSFDWSNGATTRNLANIPAGEYTVTVRDTTGLSTISTIKINEPDALLLSAFVINSSGPGTNDGSINLTVRGGTHDYFFAWDNGATSEDISNLPAGDYQVVVTDGFGCTATISETVLELGSLHMGNSHHSLSDNQLSNPNSHASNGNLTTGFYPNPAANFLSIQLKEAADVSVYNSNGQLVLINKMNTENNKIDVSNLSSGNYIVRVGSATETNSYKVSIVK